MGERTCLIWLAFNSPLNKGLAHQTTSLDVLTILQSYRLTRMFVRARKVNTVNAMH